MNKASLRKYEELHATVKKIIVEWDPIGVLQSEDWPNDEYDSYIPAICSILINSSDITTLANIFVFLDENPRSINDGFFVNRLEDYEWGNVPGSYHNNSANLAFADGHTETHRWHAPSTIPPAVDAPLDVPVAASPATDFDWLKDRTSVKR